MSNQVNYVEAPMLKKMFMEGLLNSITQGTASHKVMVMEGNICTIKDVCNPEPIEATMMRRYLNAKEKGEYLNPIGPLNEALTVFREVEKRFFSKEATPKTSKEYFKAHKVYLASIK